jgi:hypothetical protein
MSNPFKSFATTFLSADQVLTGVGTWDVVLFNIVEPDGSSTGLYNSTTGAFTSQISGWYDVTMHLQSSAALAGGVRFVRNGETAFPVSSSISTTSINDLTRRIFLAEGETIRIEANGTASILATAGTTPDARASYSIFSLIKRAEDVNVF